MGHLHLPALGAVVIELTWQTIITAGAVIAALTTIITLLVKLVRWVDKQKKQDGDIKALQEKHDKDLDALKHELTVICFGLRGALQGLIEQGCNGPCKEALNMLDKHLNKAAHDEVKP